jgi:Plavaka transposase
MKEFDGLAASANTITHLKRELVQKVWELLLDEEFMDAYQHGMVITCGDAVTRRIFPRFFTYSADYPEKYVAM